MDSPSNSQAPTQVTNNPMMNEEEVKKIIDNYNITIKKITKEIEIEGPKYNRLKERSGSLMSLRQQYREDMKKFTEQQTFYNEQIPQLQQQVEDELEYLVSDIQLNSLNLDNQPNSNTILEKDGEEEKNENSTENNSSQQQDQDLQQGQEDQEEEESKQATQNSTNNQQKESLQDLDDNINDIDLNKNQSQSEPQLDKKIGKYQTRNSVQCMTDLQKRQFFLQKKQQGEKILRQSKQFDNSILIDTQIQELFAEFFADEPKLLQSAIKIYEGLDEVKKENDILEEQKNKSLDEALNLAKAFRDTDEENMQIKKCINCNEEYSPFLNHDEACQYHMGQVRFYSCQLCGRDQYFSCCNACILCNKGCRKKKHVSTL